MHQPMSCCSFLYPVNLRKNVTVISYCSFILDRHVRKVFFFYIPFYKLSLFRCPGARLLKAPKMLFFRYEGLWNSKNRKCKKTEQNGLGFEQIPAILFFRLKYHGRVVYFCLSKFRVVSIKKSIFDNKR